jgi:hypothetical protein
LEAVFSVWSMQRLYQESLQADRPMVITWLWQTSLRLLWDSLTPGGVWEAVESQLLEGKAYHMLQWTVKCVN